MSNLACPKCGGTDFFMSTRTVMKGIGGIWGNRGGTKQFPVCRSCDEIMAEIVVETPSMPFIWGSKPETK